MKIALLQLNLTVGDILGNAERIIKAVHKLKLERINLCITSELALLGYPPRDLLFNKSFIQSAQEVLNVVAHSLKDAPALLIGTATFNVSNIGKELYNTAVLVRHGKIIRKFYKCLLPTYDVFDEDRYFESSCNNNIFSLDGLKIGVTICEDLWNDKSFYRKQIYHNNPIEKLAQGGVDYLVNLSASPFSVGKQKQREQMIGAIAMQYKLPVVYVNQVGGNDDLIFDGRSCVFDSTGKLVARAKNFTEDVLVVTTSPFFGGEINQDVSSEEEETWYALVVGTRDYVTKCGFKKVLIGISGGIDSAVTAVIATEALGKENVIGVLMPSPYTSKCSIDDVVELSNRLGIEIITISIYEIMKVFDTVLKDLFSGYVQDITEENLQARIRGVLLMALSNKFHALVLSTGNKSELAVGYCTLYGDMVGGFAVLSDLSKTYVYRLANWLNQNKGFIIPESIISKEPSAELKYDQKDCHTLPPYSSLDQILYNHIECQLSIEEIISKEFDIKLVKDVAELVKKSEFKRKQAAPGIKLTNHAFGSGWRMPIAYKNTW